MEIGKRIMAYITEKLKAHTTKKELKMYTEHFFQIKKNSANSLGYGKIFGTGLWSCMCFILDYFKCVYLKINRRVFKVIIIWPFQTDLPFTSR